MVVYVPGQLVLSDFADDFSICSNQVMYLILFARSLSVLYIMILLLDREKSRCKFLVQTLFSCVKSVDLGNSISNRCNY